MKFLHSSRGFHATVGFCVFQLRLTSSMAALRKARRKKIPPKMSDNSTPMRLISKRWVRSAVNSDLATTTARGGRDVVRKYLREIIKYLGIAFCQWRPAVMLEFYPNNEAVSSVVARFGRIR
jgi:hypothetical protein